MKKKVQVPTCKVMGSSQFCQRTSHWCGLVQALKCTAMGSSQFCLRTSHCYGLVQALKCKVMGSGQFCLPNHHLVVKMMQTCKLTKSATFLHQRHQFDNRQKWTITAQNIDIKDIVCRSDGRQLLSYCCVNCGNCSKQWLLQMKC